MPGVGTRVAQWVEGVSVYFDHMPTTPENDTSRYSGGGEWGTRNMEEESSGLVVSGDPRSLCSGLCSVRRGRVRSVVVVKPAMKDAVTATTRPRSTYSQCATQPLRNWLMMSLITGEPGPQNHSV